MTDKLNPEALPELVEALDRALHLFKNFQLTTGAKGEAWSPTGMIEEAEDALAKARGE